MKLKIIGVIAAVLIIVFVLLEITGIFGALNTVVFAFDKKGQEARNQAIAQEAYEEGYQDGYKDGYADGLLDGGEQ